MNKSEFNKLLRDIYKAIDFLNLVPNDNNKIRNTEYFYSIKVNAGCVRDTADLWDDWAELWNMDSFISNYSERYERITQVTLCVFRPLHATTYDYSEVIKHYYLVFDIRNRLSEGYLFGTKKWPYY